MVPPACQEAGGSAHLDGHRIIRAGGGDQGHPPGEDCRGPRDLPARRHGEVQTDSEEGGPARCHTGRAFGDFPGNPDTDTDALPHAGTNANSFTHALPHTEADANADSQTNSFTHAEGDPKTYSQANPEADSDTRGRSVTGSNPEAQAKALGKTFPEAFSQTDPARLAQAQAEG